jgi:HD superfamily phosphohydrolase YqeK
MWPSLRRNALIDVQSLIIDSVKCLKLGQLQAIAKRYHLAQDDPRAMKSNALLHGKVGAVLAEYKYHVQDEDVLNAIRYASVIVHIFTREDRGFYRLERLWSDGQNRLPLPYEEESNTEA